MTFNHNYHRSKRKCRFRPWQRRCRTYDESVSKSDQSVTGTGDSYHLETKERVIRWSVLFLKSKKSLLE